MTAVKTWQERCTLKTTARAERDLMQSEIDDLRSETERVTQRLKITSDAMNSYILERDTLRAELEAIRATDKDAGLVADGWKLTVRDLIVSHSMNASCQAGLVPRCICVKCATERAEYMLATSPKLGGV